MKITPTLAKVGFECSAIVEVDIKSIVVEKRCYSRSRHGEDRFWHGWRSYFAIQLKGELSIGIHIDLRLENENQTRYSTASKGISKVAIRQKLERLV